jgi:hypothetical protein
MGRGCGEGWERRKEGGKTQGRRTRRRCDRIERRSKESTGRKGSEEVMCQPPGERTSEGLLALVQYQIDELIEPPQNPRH